MGLFSNQYRIVARMECCVEEKYVIQVRNWDSIWFGDWYDLRHHTLELHYNSFQEAENDLVDVIPKMDKNDVVVRKYKRDEFYNK